MYIQCENVPERFGSPGSEGESPAYPPTLDRLLPASRDGWPQRCRRWFDQAKAKSLPSMVPGTPRVRPVSIAMVALSPTTEVQLRAACLDVAAMGQGYSVALAQWNGQCADVVIAECDDVYGGLVCALAIRSRSRIVRVSAGLQTMAQRGDDGVFRTLSHADLTALLAGLCAEALAHDRRAGGAPDGAMPELSGLPHTCLLSQAIPQETTGWIASVHERNRVRLHRISSRIQAPSPWHLEEAGRQLLSPAWRPASDHGADPSGVETSLDLFLLRACLSQQAALPRLDAAHFRLAHWPDLDGQEPQYAWVLPLMATVVRQAPVSVPKLAGHKAPPSGQINAMFWAFWASGVLERIAMPRDHRPS